MSAAQRVYRQQTVPSALHNPRRYTKPDADIHLPDAFPSSVAFDAIQSSLKSDEAGRQDAIKKGGAIFAFTLKNKAGATESWYIDLKDAGEVGKGEPPKKANVTLSLSDENFGKLVSGKANAQKLFMSGALKVKGDVMKATKMEPILKKAQTNAKL